MNSLLLKNGLCVTLAPLALERVDLRLSGGAIVEQGQDLRPENGDIVVDLTGKIVMPGLVCSHTHLYSSFSRGMPGPDTSPSTFLEILQRIWWRLDRALDAETIYFSALAGALDAARCGVTTVVDHHSSPHAVSGSLSLIAKALAEVGLRGVLCYETSDRDGIDCRDQGLAENEEFLKGHSSHDMYRGLAGGHASFTLSDESLRKLGEIAERFDTGVHVHLAEADTDPQMTELKFGRSILDRFTASGILRRRSVFAHCIHLTHDDFARLRSSGAWLVHNPRSNMNNRVGQARLGEFGARIALGTDGLPPDMFEELRAAFFKNQEGRTVAKEVFVAMLDNGQQLISEIFGRQFGNFRKNAPADLIVVDYVPPTPMTQQNLSSHLFFGLRSSMVESVMVNGRWLVRNRAFVHLNEQELLRGAADAARRLWSAMHAITV
ncbi:MAG: putative aminohydrolase SsnA [Bacteroidota bacterium]